MHLMHAIWMHAAVSCISAEQISLLLLKLTALDNGSSQTGQHRTAGKGIVHTLFHHDHGLLHGTEKAELNLAQVIQVLLCCALL